MKWKIVKRKLTELKPFEKNPRKMTEKGMKDLKTSISKFGIAEPIVINTDNTIIGGHARYYAISDNGTEDVECYQPEKKLTPKEFKELNVRLNKNIAGEFDFDILANEFELDDLLEWGFEEKELDLDLWNDKTDEQLDEVPEPQKEAVSKLGDLFELDGKHRVYCGDATNKAHVGQLMCDVKADMVFTDPPYNVDYGYSKKNPHPSHKNRSIEGDKQTHAEWIEFNEKLVQIFKEYCLGDLYMWGASGYDGMKARCIMIEGGLHWSATIVWKKQQLVLTPAKYQRIYEPCLYGWFDRSSFVGDRKNTEVWEVNRPLSSKLHPTMKPIELCAKGITLSSNQKNIVMDIFLGSGSTLIACEQTNRICYGMEIDPIYIDVILRRYHNLYPDKKIECISREYDNSPLLFPFDELWQDQ